MKLSARNQFKGTVSGIDEGAVNAIVRIDIGGGHTVSATISMASVKELGPRVGNPAYAVVKATSVMVEPTADFPAVPEKEKLLAAAPKPEAQSGVF